MKLREAEPGSIVVIDEGGLRSIVELGALSCESRKGRRKVELAELVHGAIVHDLDDQTLRYIAPRLARSADPDADVVFVVASVHWLRRIRDIGARVRSSGMGSVRDPLASRAD